MQRARATRRASGGAPLAVTGQLAFTKDSFTSKPLWTNHSSYYCPCPHYCNTSALLLRSIQVPPTPLVCATHRIQLGEPEGEGGAVCVGWCANDSYRSAALCGGHE